MTTAAAAAVPAANPLRGIALIALGLAAATISDALVKSLTDSYPALQLSWGRYFFNLVAMLAGLVLWRGPSGLRGLATTRRPAFQIGRALLFSTEATSFILAFAFLPLAEVIAISFLAPLFLIGLAAMLLREHVQLYKWLAALVGFAGMLLMVWPSGGGTLNWGTGFALAAALLWALVQVLTRAIHAESPLVTLFYTAAVGTVALSVPMPFVWVSPDLIAWALMAGAGVAICLFHLFIIMAFRLAPAATLAPFNYSQLIWAALIGAVVFAEIPGLTTAVGAAVIVAAGLYVWWRERAAPAPLP